MKDRPDRTARLQLIESMFAGHSWQAAVAQSQLKISRSTAYRLIQLARNEEKAASAFLDDRHGHSYKITKPVQMWLVEICTKDPQIPSSQLQVELKTTFGTEVSIGHINRIRAQYGVTKPGRGRVRISAKKRLNGKLHWSK
ncbi:MAG: helix-turn-helix domain-containing protein [Ktedonobacteraceae bacterium]|nr:helix-turn-helix domain-containing protein [Ktedonobacteraceae bacterium]